MKIFLDTNVVLDWLLDRQDTFANEATTIIEAAETGKLTAYISAGSVYTLAYVLEKSGRKGTKLRNAMQEVLSILNVMPADNTPYEKACQRPMRDLEDAFQYELAMHGERLDYFVTGNLRDFAAQDTKVLPVVTPAQMVKLF